MSTTPLPPSDGWQLRLVYFQDGEPIMHQASADLEAENKRLREALLDCKTNARKEGLVKRIVDLALENTK